MSELSQNEYAALQVIEAGKGATAEAIASAMDVSISYVYDLISALRRKGRPVRQDSEGRYYHSDEGQDGDPDHFVTTTRITSGNKSAITQRAAATLAEIEFQLKQKLKQTEPAVADGGFHFNREGNTDLIIHRTDDHFGEHIVNTDGDDVFNSDIAEARVRKVYQQSIAKTERREDAGEEFDTAHLLMGGDHVTNDAIYEGQKNETDATVREQIDRCADVYLDIIKGLSDKFPQVQVACQVGNHGRLESASVNADGIVFSMLDKIVRESNKLNNVTFMQNDRSYYINFPLRHYRAHLRHGHDSSLEHIGTSAGKQRWLSWLVDHDFDVAFRGHYHMYKEEPINGTPVHMGGAIVPQTEFEESHALSGRPMAAIHGATEVAPTEWTEKIYFE